MPALDDVVVLCQFSAEDVDMLSEISRQYENMVPDEDDELPAWLRQVLANLREAQSLAMAAGGQ